MQRGEEEGPHAKRAANARRPGPPEERRQRRAGQGRDERHQREQPELIERRGHRVGAQPPGSGVEGHHHQRHRAARHTPRERASLAASPSGPQGSDGRAVVLRLEDALPATSTLAPAVDDLPSPVFSLMPPSTSMSTFESPRASSMRPQPPHLVQRAGDERLPAEARVHAHDSTCSTSPSTSSIADSGVAGLSTTAGFAPECADLLQRAVQVRARLDVHADRCAPRPSRSRRRSAPARRSSGARRAAAWSRLRTASTTTGPMVMFGTKRPSITSTWT